MSLRNSSFVFGFGTMVAGCAGPAQPGQHSVLGSPPPATTALFRGSYNGLMQLASGSPDSCGTEDIFSLQVRANSFQYVLQQPQVPWRPTVTFAVDIAPDGSFVTKSGAASIVGQVKQGHMQGQIVGDACGFSFEADNDGSF